MYTELATALGTSIMGALFVCVMLVRAWVFAKSLIQ